MGTKQYLMLMTTDIFPHIRDVLRLIFNAYIPMTSKLICLIISLDMFSDRNVLSEQKILFVRDTEIELWKHLSVRNALMFQLQ